jgi:hypothetical protein
MCGTMQPWKHHGHAPNKKWIGLQEAEREAAAACAEYQAKIEERFRKGAK